MKRVILGTLAMICLCSAMCFVFGCSSSSHSPSGPTTQVNDFYINGSYHYFPAGNLAGVINGALLIVREDSSTGPVVTDATVTIGGTQMSFNGTQGAYTGVSATITSGQAVSFAVSDGLGTVSTSCQVPFHPTNLLLSNLGVWDTSSLVAVNSLTWTNPVAVGEALSIAIFDYNGATTQPLFFDVAPNASVVGINISNTALAYYQGISSVLVLVLQSNDADFSDNPGNSEVTMYTVLSGIFPVSNAVSMSQTPPPEIPEWVELAGEETSGPSDPFLYLRSNNAGH